MQNTSISNSLRAWYREHKRDLPWRGLTDPYHIWVSEIILQQTRVVQGIPFYNRFINAFPDISSLASATPAEVLKVWQGLGYYTRARNMHETAVFIVRHLGGQFPGNYDGLLKLKGIGRNTAAAIASLAFNEPVPVIDGNVYRVLSRLSGIRHPVNNSKAYSIFHKKAIGLMDRTHPGEYNQAIMELGALVCLPSSPDCRQCPLSGTCYAFARGLTGQLPVRENKTSVMSRYFHYFIIEAGCDVYLNHRVEADIWKGLYDFPLIETAGPVDPEHFIHREEWKKFFGNSTVEVIRVSRPVKHRLTHRLITARFYHIRTGKDFSFREDNYIRTGKNKVSDYPLPKLIENYLAEEGWIV